MHASGREQPKQHSESSEVRTGIECHCDGRSSIGYTQPPSQLSFAIPAGRCGAGWQCTGRGPNPVTQLPRRPGGQCGDELSGQSCHQLHVPLHREPIQVGDVLTGLLANRTGPELQRRLQATAKNSCIPGFFLSPIMCGSQNRRGKGDCCCCLQDAWHCCCAC